MKYFITTLAFLASVSCSSPSVPKGQVPPEKDQKISSDAGLEVLDPKVDILFLVDNSGSMSTHQANLARNMNLFISNFFGKMQVDFHIGVITTDNASGEKCCGKLIGSPSFVTKTVGNFQDILKTRLMVGTDGSYTEMVFDPLYAALSEPYISTINSGFLRPDASLAVVIITDAEDQSEKMDAGRTYDYLVTLKKRPEKVLLYGAIVPSGPTDCGRDDPRNYPARIERFLSMSVTNGNNSFALCDQDFGARLSDLGLDLAKRVGNTMYLNRFPIASTIEVEYGTQIIPADSIKGWTYDPERNAIVFGSQIEWTDQPAGTKVSVKYDFTQFKQ